MSILKKTKNHLNWILAASLAVVASSCSHGQVKNEAIPTNDENPQTAPTDAPARRVQPIKTAEVESPAAVSEAEVLKESETAAQPTQAPQPVALSAGVAETPTTDEPAAKVVTESTIETAKEAPAKAESSALTQAESASSAETTAAQPVTEQPAARTSATEAARPVAASDVKYVAPASEPAADADRFLASAPSEISLFEGAYALVQGSARTCSSSLNVSVDFSSSHDIEKIHMSDDYILDVVSGQRPSSETLGKCSVSIDDQLSDNYDKISATGRKVGPTDAQWEVKRSFYKLCPGRTVPALAGFHVWELTPRGTTGLPEVSLHSILGKEYECSYRKNQ